MQHNVSLSFATLATLIVRMVYGFISSAEKSTRNQITKRRWTSGRKEDNWKREEKQMLSLWKRKQLHLNKRNRNALFIHDKWEKWEEESFLISVGFFSRFCPFFGPEPQHRFYFFALEKKKKWDQVNGHQQCVEVNIVPSRRLPTARKMLTNVGIFFSARTTEQRVFANEWKSML